MSVMCRAPQPTLHLGCGKKATWLYRLGRTKAPMRGVCDDCLANLRRRVAGRDKIITKPVEEAT